MNSIRFMACRFPGPAFQCGGSHLFRSAREICFAGQEVLTLTSDFASDSWMSKIIGPALRRFIFPRPSSSFKVVWHLMVVHPCFLVNLSMPLNEV